METTALALRMLYGADHGLDTTTFYELAQLVRERSHQAVPTNRAVTGERLFEVESGIVAGFYNNCIASRPLELFPYHWSQVGQPQPRIVFGKGSGTPSLDAVPGLAGASDDRRMAVLGRIKTLATRQKSLLSLEQVQAIAAGLPDDD
jgi:isopropylmalate/homocitrate/citramalate synthase